MSKKVSILENKWLHLVVALLSFYLISELLASYPTWQVTAYMAFGTFWLVDLLWIFFKDTYCYLGLYIVIFVGSTLCLLFMAWLGNTVLKMLNPLFVELNWDFRIGNLYNGIYQYVFSIPSLIAGVFLIFVSMVWDNNVHYRIWHAMTGKPEVESKKDIA